MPRKSPPFTLEEIPGNQFADLRAAQEAALQATAADLAAILRSLLASGVLVQRDGRIAPNTKVESC